MHPQQHKKLYEVCTKIYQAIEQGKTAPAIKKLDELNAKFPNQPMILSLIGRVNGKMGRHKESIDGYGQAVKADPKNPESRFDYALALQKGGEYEQSLEEYERTLYYAPNHFLALRHKCSVLTDLDRNDEALDILNKLKASIKGRKTTPGQRLAVAVSQARLAPKVCDAQESIEEIQSAMIEKDDDIGVRVAGYWQMGRLFDHLKEYDKAFESYKQCKEIKKDKWDPDEHSQRVDQLINCWSTDANIPFSDIDGSRLIFIVGMMRSGTSLTEQMISQVPSVTPGGEMNAISRQVSRVDQTTMAHARPYPLTQRVYTQSTINTMAKNAMVMFNEIAKEGYLTDKQPYNYPYVPLISHMFPGCKIIHCVRNPLDCLLSNYTQAFSRPHMQTHDMYWLGRFFRDYERLMKHWHTLPEVDMIDLQYEELVQNPEFESKRVMEFLEIPWNEDILNFHKSKRTVSTASRDQVRQPVYTSSVQKYKRYEKHLDELKRGLGMLDTD
ncbi:MAG: sulfotransferase [Phycisphaerales bacterium]|nr:sulfotransferase [Phycisphaerales bacterium]